jgi:hypothetical protein
MAKKFQLDINDPCSENWDEMTSTGCGRFCNSCQKQVVDFTKMDDQQLALFFQKNTANVCGRLRQDQLGKDLVVPRKQIPWFRYLLKMIIPAMLFSNKGYTQGAVRKVLPRTLQTPVDITRIKTMPDDTISKRTITGRVVDLDGNGIEAASVILQGTGTGAITTKDGFFRLTTTSNDRVFRLEVSMIGYTSIQVQYSANEAGKEILIPLAMKVPEIMYVGFIAPKIVEKEKVSKKVQELKTLSHMDTTTLKLYPNPVASGASVNIELTAVVREDYYEFSLVNFNGKTIFGKKVWIDKDARVMNIEIPSIAAGSYFAVLRNKKLRRELAQQIMVTK